VLPIAVGNLSKHSRDSDSDSDPRHDKSKRDHEDANPLHAHVITSSRTESLALEASSSARVHSSPVEPEAKNTRTTATVRTGAGVSIRRAEQRLVAKLSAGVLVRAYLDQQRGVSAGDGSTAIGVWNSSSSLRAQTQTQPTNVLLRAREEVLFYGNEMRKSEGTGEEIAGKNLKEIGAGAVIGLLNGTGVAAATGTDQSALGASSNITRLIAAKILSISSETWIQDHQSYGSGVTTNVSLSLGAGNHDYEQANTYVVQPGDTMTQIAAMHNVPLCELLYTCVWRGSGMYMCFGYSDCG
jgi:hypothetical protein